MLTPNDQIFLQRPEDFTRRILHPGEIVGVTANSFAVRMAEVFAVEIDQTLQIYFEVDREFMQQPVRVIEPPEVEATAETEDVSGTSPARQGDPVDLVGAIGALAADSIVHVETTGPFMSAECRECYRVSTVTANLTAAVGSEEHCQLLDVSATGFSVIATGAYKIGDVLPAVLYFEDKQFSGSACVQSIKELITGLTRYGLRSNGRNRGAGNLDRGQQKISMVVQRRQLKRQAGRH